MGRFYNVGQRLIILLAISSSLCSAQDEQKSSIKIVFASEVAYLHPYGTTFVYGMSTNKGGLTWGQWYENLRNRDKFPEQYVGNGSLKVKNLRSAVDLTAFIKSKSAPLIKHLLESYGCESSFEFPAEDSGLAIDTNLPSYEVLMKCTRATEIEIEAVYLGEVEHYPELKSKGYAFSPVEIRGSVITNEVEYSFSLGYPVHYRFHP